MKVGLDESLCVGHGRCYELAPDVFGEDEQGHCRLLVEDLGEDLVAQAQRGADNCPERAIVVEED